MRYIVEFMNGTWKRISEDEGTSLMKACAERVDYVMIRGAMFPRTQITAIKPVNETWIKGVKNDELDTPDLLPPPDAT